MADRCFRCDSTLGHYESCPLHPLRVRSQLASVTTRDAELYEDLRAFAEGHRQRGDNLATQFATAHKEAAELRAERDAAIDRLRRFRGWRVRFEWFRSASKTWVSEHTYISDWGTARANAGGMRQSPLWHRNIRIVRVFSAAKRGK